MNANPFAESRSNFGGTEEISAWTAIACDVALKDELDPRGKIFRANLEAVARGDEPFSKYALELTEILDVATSAECEVARRANDPDPGQLMREPVTRKILHPNAGCSVAPWPKDLVAPIRRQTLSNIAARMCNASNLVRGLLARAAGAHNSHSVKIFSALDQDQRRVVVVVLAIALKKILQPKIGLRVTDDKVFREMLTVWSSRLVEGEMVP